MCFSCYAHVVELPLARYFQSSRIGWMILVLTGMTRPIKDEHSREDYVTPVTNPDNARVIDGHKVAIQYLQ